MIKEWCENAWITPLIGMDGRRKAELSAHDPFFLPVGQFRPLASE
jgi:hypothetical protein